MSKWPNRIRPINNRYQQWIRTVVRDNFRSLYILSKDFCFSCCKISFY
nr:MAG TPA: hypothetical protein [Caudoviricetes sp.]